MADLQCTADDPTGLAELHRQVNAGPGPAAIEPAVAGIGGFAPRLSESADRVNAALRGTGVSWQGHTAQAAADSLTGVSRWALTGGDHAGAGGGQVQAYADSFVELRSKVAGPEAVPTLSRWDSVWETIGVTSDHGQVVQRNHQAAVAALDALQVHQQNTDQAIAGFPDLATVPRSGAESGEPIGPGGQAGVGPGRGLAGSGPADGHPEAATHGAAVGTSSATAGGGQHDPRAGGGGAGSSGAGGAGPISAPGSSSSGHPGGPIGRGPRPGAAPNPRPGTGLRPGAAPGARPGAGASSRPGTGFDSATGPRSDPARPGASRGGPPPMPNLGAGAGGWPGSGREPAPRAGTSIAPPHADPHGGPAGARTSTGAGGYGPMMGGAGAAGGERTHRNQHFIPSDEPFRVEFTDVVPPVLGATPVEDT